MDSESISDIFSYIKLSFCIKLSPMSCSILNIFRKMSCFLDFSGFFSQLEFRKKTSQIETYRSNLDPLRLRMLARHGPFLHIRGEVTSILVNFLDDFSNKLMMLVNIL